MKSENHFISQIRFVAVFATAVVCLALSQHSIAQTKAWDSASTLSGIVLPQRAKTVQSNPVPSARNIEPAPVWQNQAQPLPRIAESGRAIAPSVRRVASVAAPTTEFEPTPIAISSDGETTTDEIWWQPQVTAPMRGTTNYLNVSVESLIIGALNHSAQIETYRDLPLIREAAIVEADAAFDWTRFFDSRWNDFNDPVGSTLTTGNSSRYNNHEFSASTGSRLKNRNGGEFEIAQQIGHQDTNSTFFVPKNQGTARLKVSYTQPLLNGRGQVYNNSIVVLARVDADAASDELSRQLQSHLLEVTRSYWGLFLERGNLALQQRLLQRTQDTVDLLESRQEIDTYRSQLIRAKAALADHKSEIVRANAAVKNAEARIRALVNDPALGADEQTELVPSDLPSSVLFPAAIGDAMTSALQLRPEILQVTKQIHAACVRINVAQHEILPILNLIAQSYVAGLRGDSDIPDAMLDQFRDGAPSYSVGLQYEIPVGNRAAQARLQRRRLEVRQLESQFRATSETVKLEVEVAVREVHTAHEEMLAKGQSAQATTEELDYIKTRWENLTGQDGDASLVLDNLLRVQERVASAEYELLNAQMTYNLSLMNLKRASGTLLQSESISEQRFVEDGLPRITHEKSAGQ